MEEGHSSKTTKIYLKHRLRVCLDTYENSLILTILFPWVTVSTGNRNSGHWSFMEFTLRHDIILFFLLIQLPHCLSDSLFIENMIVSILIFIMIVPFKHWFMGLISTRFPLPLFTILSWSGMDNVLNIVGRIKLFVLLALLNRSLVFLLKLFSIFWFWQHLFRY